MAVFNVSAFGIMCHAGPATKLPRVRTRIKAGGNGVPNDGPFAHYSDNTLNGYWIWYHDQTITGDAWLKSPEMTPSGYAALHAEALVSEQAFLTKLATTAWDAWLTSNTGVSRSALRAKVIKLTP